MKICLILGLALFSVGTFARDISLKVDISRHLGNLLGAKLSLTYVSQSMSFGCRRLTGNILNPTGPIFIEKSISLKNGIASAVIPTTVAHCGAKLAEVNLKLNLNREAIARAENVSISEVDKNRVDLDFPVFEAGSEQELEDSELQIAQLYVAGSHELKYTYTCRSQFAGIFKDIIDLSL